ncbi:MAG: VOC family protein [Bacteroidota bacterium]
MINICSDKLLESKNFYTRLFDLQVEYDSDWFVHLAARDKQFEIGIIDRTNPIVPKEFQQNPQGSYLTFVVDNADDVYEIAIRERFDILEEPHNTFYGQRRLLLKDPNGALVDVSSPILNFE